MIICFYHMIRRLFFNINLKKIFGLIKEFSIVNIKLYLYMFNFLVFLFEYFNILI